VDYLDVISARMMRNVPSGSPRSDRVQIANVHRKAPSAIASARWRPPDGRGSVGRVVGIPGHRAGLCDRPRAVSVAVVVRGVGEILEGKRFVLVDQAVAAGLRILLDHRGKTFAAGDPVR